MFFPNPEWILKISRDQRNLDQEWQELRTWVQRYQHLFRMAGIAREVGISAQIATTLLLRDVSASRLSRNWERLDAFLLVFMRPPFHYVPSNWRLLWQ